MRGVQPISSELISHSVCLYSICVLLAFIRAVGQEKCPCPSRFIHSPYIPPARCVTNNDELQKATTGASPVILKPVALV